MPYEVSIFRNGEQDYNTQCMQVENRGWIRMDAEFNQINLGLGPWVDVTPEQGTLFKKGEDTNLTLNIEVASPYKRINFMLCPYVYVVRKPIKYHILNRVEAGTIIGVYGFREKEQSE